MKAPRHSRLIILGSGRQATAQRYTPRGQPQSAAHHRRRTGRPAHDDDRCRQLAGRRARPAGPGLMDRMREHAERFNTQIVNDHIHKVDFSKRPLELPWRLGRLHLRCADRRDWRRAKYLGLPSEDAFRGKGVSACATCDGFFFRNQHVAVVGGGNTAVEEALYLLEHRRACHARSFAVTSCAPRRCCRIGCSNACMRAK